MKILRFLTHNLGLKILSLLLACVIWLAWIDEPSLVTSLNVPVEFRNFPAGLDIGGEENFPDRVQLQVQGPRSVLAGATSMTSAVILDLRGFTRPGERTFDVSSSIVGLPARVALVRSYPSQLRVTMERRVSRNVPVRLRFGEAPPPGYRIVRQRIDPATIHISGAERHVNNVQAAQTDPFDFENIDNTQQEIICEATLHTFVDDQRVSIDSKATVNAQVVLQKIRN